MFLILIKYLPSATSASEHSACVTKYSFVCGTPLDIESKQILYQTAKLLIFLQFSKYTK